MSVLHTLVDRWGHPYCFGVADRTFGSEICSGVEEFHVCSYHWVPWAFREIGFAGEEVPWTFQEIGFAGEEWSVIGRTFGLFLSLEVVVDRCGLHWTYDGVIVGGR